jgi:general secretion pathway protein C
MQRTVFYAILGISIVITAISLGYSTSRYVSARTYAPPAPRADPAPAAARGSEAALPAERWTNLFAPSAGMGIPSRLPGGGAPAAVVAESDTDYVLLGTIYSDSRAFRRAILWAEGMTNPLLAREQEEIEPGVRVASVGREHVVLHRGAREERVELLPVGSRARTPAPRVAAGATKTVARAREARAAPAAGVAVNVSRIGENAYSLDEATIGQLTGNINQFMTQVRIIPYFEGNKSAGYRLAAMRPGSAFEQLGFRGGDVIQRVNDVELTTPEKMYTIFQNLKDEKRVTVDVLRQGQKTTLRYEIR